MNVVNILFVFKFCKEKSHITFKYTIISFN